MTKRKIVLFILIFICSVLFFSRDIVLYSSQTTDEDSEDKTIYDDDADLLEVGRYLSEKNYLQVIHVCRKILNRYPEHLIALKYIIMAYNELDESSFAAEYYERYRTIDYGNADIHLWGAELYLKAGDYDSAIDSSLTAVNLGVEHIYKAYYIIASSYKELGKNGKAMYYTKLSIEHKDSFVQSHYLLASLYESNGLFKEAENTYYILKRLDNQSIIPVISLSLLYYKMGRTDKSRGLVRDTFLGKVSAFPYFIYSLNQDYSSFTYYKDIVEAFLMVYEENKDDVALNRNFGYIYYLLGDYDSAMSYLNRARSLTDSGMDFLNEFLISMILFRTGETEKSISLLKKINDYFPNNLDVLSLLGYLYHRIGRDDVGIKFTNKALSLNSDKPINLYFYLSLNYIGLNKLYKAKQVIEKIKGKNYIPEYYLISSYLSAEFRNFEDSYRYFEKYIKLQGSIDKNSISDIFAEKSFLRLYNHKAFYKNINELIIKYYSTH